MKAIHFTEIDSTNTYLLEHYEELEHYTFISADVQTKGKGRNDRKWQSENGKNLLFSLLFKDPSFFPYYRSISIVSSLAIVRVLKSYNIDNVMIKWPNDVYVNDRKITGILLQAVTRNEMECLVVGIGTNVNQKTFDGDYLHAPTSVSFETGKEIDLEEFRNRVYEQMILCMDALVKGYDFLEEIRQYDYLKGMKCLAEIDGERKKVEVLGINHQFELDVLADGEKRSVGTGEITFHIQ